MNLKEWFNESIRDKALKILDQLAATLKDPGGNPDWRQAVKVFADFCNNTLQPPLLDIVNSIISQLKLSDTVSDIRDFWQKIPIEVRTLLTQSLSDSNTSISWPILGAKGQGFNYGNLKGPWNSVLSFRANTSASLNIQALEANNPALQAPNLTCAASERQLRLGFQGNMVLTAGGALPLGFVKISSTVSAQTESTGNTSLDYYYRDPAQWLFVEALCHNLPHLACPLDPTDLLKEMNTNLSAIQLNLGGTFKANLGMSAGATWGTQFNVTDSDLNLNTQVQVGASAQLGYQTNLNLSGSWNLLVKPSASNTGKLALTLRKNAGDSSDNTFSLNASLGFNGLDVVGDAIIKKYMPDATPLLTALTPYLNIGDLLKQELIKELAGLLNVGQDPNSDALKQALASFLVGDNRAANLADVLGEAAKNALNKELTLLQTKAQDAGTKLLANMVNDLKLPSELGQKLLAAATGKISSILGNLRKKLQTDLTQILGQAQNNLTALLKPMETVGLDIKTLVGDLNQLSQELLDPVIQFLDKYQKLRQKITDAITASKSLTLGMYFKRISQSDNFYSSFLEFILDPNHAEAVEFYQEMLVGNFTNALNAAQQSPDGARGIQLSGGSFKAVADHKVTSDLTLNVFGTSFTASTLMDSDVQVQVDVSGNIMMATSNAEFQRVYSGLGESRTVQFINHFELPGAVPMEAGFNALKLIGSGLSMTYSDKKLSAKELKSYLGSVEGANLISPQSLQAGVTRYNQLAAQAAQSGQKLGAEIGLNMIFTSKDLQTLINTPDLDIQNKAIHNQLVSFFYNNGQKYLTFNAVLLKWYRCSTDVYQQIKDIAACDALGDVLIRYDVGKATPENRRNPQDVPDWVRHYLNIAWNTGRNASNLVRIVQNFRHATQLTLSPQTLEEDVKTLNDYNRQMNQYLKDWLKVRGILSDLGIKDESVPAVTLAFIATIGEICNMGYQGTQFLTPTVKWSILNNQMELF